MTAGISIRISSLASVGIGPAAKHIPYEAQWNVMCLFDLHLTCTPMDGHQCISQGEQSCFVKSNVQMWNKCSQFTGGDSRLQN